MSGSATRFSRLRLAAACLLGVAAAIAPEFLSAQTAPATGPAGTGPAVAATGRGRGGRGGRGGLARGGAPGAGAGGNGRTVSAAPTIIKQADGVPSLYVVSDSTAAKSRTPTIEGWGVPFLTYFDPTKINVVNNAFGGRSSRTFMNEGKLEDLIGKLKQGDTVLIQWGHNDSYDLFDANGRGSLHGLGDETMEVTRFDGKPEVLHTFGWYMRYEVARIRGAGAIPIIMTLTVRDRWNADGTIERNPLPNINMDNLNRFHEPPIYSVWSAQIAQQVFTTLLDVHNMIADHDEKVGKDVVSTYYNSAGDPTHRNPTGAAVDAEISLACLKTLEGPAFDDMLNEKGKAVAAADPKYVAKNILPGTDPDPNSKLSLQPFHYGGSLNLEEDDPHTPRVGKMVLGLAGDSTVTYDQGYAAGLRAHLSKDLQVYNRSRGGATCASFRQQGRWQDILDYKPDYVMIQFGHNDGSRDLPGYSANLGRFVDEARAAGIKPILVTPISRRYWDEKGEIHDDTEANAAAMKKVAADKGCLLMDLHQAAVDFYIKCGQPVTETWGLAKQNPAITAATRPDLLEPVVLDKTHFNPEGSRAIGKTVSDTLKKSVPELAQYCE